jgi:hypothetical protein
VVEDEVVAFPRQRVEVQAEAVDGGAEGEAGVRRAGGDGEGDLEVRAELGAVDAVGVQAGGGGEAVEQDAGSGAGCAFGDPPAAEVGDAGDSVRVAGGQEQALFAAPEVDERGPIPAQGRTGEPDVVRTVGVAQVDRCAVGVVSGQSEQCVQAAADADDGDGGSDVAQQKIERGIVAAGARRRRPQRRSGRAGGRR